jgi:hypothetical protein
LLLQLVCSSVIYMYLVALTISFRAPDGAKIKNKMLFASSKDALRRQLVGISTEIQGSDVGEVDFATGTCILHSFRRLLNDWV